MNIYLNKEIDRISNIHYNFYTNQKNTIDRLVWDKLVDEFKKEAELIRIKPKEITTYGGFCALAVSICACVKLMIDQSNNPLFSVNDALLHLLCRKEGALYK